MEGWLQTRPPHSLAVSQGSLGLCFHTDVLARTVQATVPAPPTHLCTSVTINKDMAEAASTLERPHRSALLPVLRNVSLWKNPVPDKESKKAEQNQDHGEFLSFQGSPQEVVLSISRLCSEFWYFPLPFEYFGHLM